MSSLVQISSVLPGLHHFDDSNVELFFGIKGIKTSSQELLKSLSKFQDQHRTVVELEKAYVAKHNPTATS